MSELRIMFTGIGRGVELLQAFRRAAIYSRVDLKIVGADMTPTAPALVFCNLQRMVCGMKEVAYIPQLIKFCRVDNVDLLIPTIDTDLQILA